MKANVEAIKLYLQRHYTDQMLADTLAHAQDGKLCYASCCCLAGIPTAPHALQGENWLEVRLMKNNHEIMALDNLKGAYDAARAFLELGHEDRERRERIIPILLKEIARRESIRKQATETKQEEVHA